MSIFNEIEAKTDLLWPPGVWGRGDAHLKQLYPVVVISTFWLPVLSATASEPLFGTTPSLAAAEASRISCRRIGRLRANVLEKFAASLAEKPTKTYYVVKGEEDNLARPAGVLPSEAHALISAAELAEIDVFIESGTGYGVAAEYIAVNLDSWVTRLKKSFQFVSLDLEGSCGGDKEKINATPGRICVSADDTWNATVDRVRARVWERTTGHPGVPPEQTMKNGAATGSQELPKKRTFAGRGRSTFTFLADTNSRDVLFPMLRRIPESKKIGLFLDGPKGRMAYELGRELFTVFPNVQWFALHDTNLAFRGNRSSIAEYGTERPPFDHYNRKLDHCADLKSDPEALAWAGREEERSRRERTADEARKAAGLDSRSYRPSMVRSREFDLRPDVAEYRMSRAYVHGGYLDPRVRDALFERKEVVVGGGQSFLCGLNKLSMLSRGRERNSLYPRPNWLDPSPNALHLSPNLLHDPLSPLSLPPHPPLPLPRSPRITSLHFFLGGLHSQERVAFPPHSRDTATPYLNHVLSPHSPGGNRGFRYVVDAGLRAAGGGGHDFGRISGAVRSFGRGKHYSSAAKVD